MRTPTTEQQAVLADTSRVRVVRASPGSGKTVLVGMLIRNELQSWTAAPGGIAALSFTRVGGHEIQRELGYTLGHPHFIGTLDAFVFRFIVRPFVRKVHPTWAAPRLIPADWSPNRWGKAPGGVQWDHRGAGGRNAKTYNLFNVCFVDEDTHGPVLAHPVRYQGGLTQIPSADRAGVLAAKREVWQRLGWLTHADGAWIANSLLRDNTHGPAIRTSLLRRFPLLIIDELQDTGFFLTQSIRALLDHPSARGVLVGDPNQAIYEFNGARPALFDEFEQIPSARSLPLGRSKRCPCTIVTSASYVKEFTDAFIGAPNQPGRSILVQYTDLNADIPRVVDAVRNSKPTATTKVIARHTKTVEELTARSVKSVPSLHCPALTHLHRAVRAFRHGHNVKALANARAALELAVFGHEGVTDQDLETQSVDPREWKSLAIQCLFKCNSLATTTNLRDWQSAAAGTLDAEVTAFGLPASLPFQSGKLKPQKRDGWDKPCSDFLPTGTLVGPHIGDIPVQTVHSVKGETHDVTILVCPATNTAAKCPSTVWWPNAPEHREERRIAYVAMTRTRGDLIVCVADACHGRLSQSQATFVDSFQSMTVDEFVNTYPLPHTNGALVPDS